MPVYKYEAVNSRKQHVKGKFIAENEKELAAALAKQNLYVVSSSVAKEGTPSAFFTLGTGKVSLKELTTFCRQFSIMLTAGIPVLSCLENLKKQKYSAYFRSILQVIYDDVKGGDMLSTAIDKHKKVFPNFFRNMVHIGEASGRLSVVFVSLADYYESDAAVKRKAKSALAYPMMLLMMTVAIVILMLTYVVPTFRDTMDKLEVDVQGFTRVVYSLSEWLIANWHLCVLVVIVVGLLLFLFFCTNKGKYTWDVFKVRAPIIGKIQKDLITARFARALSLLLSSGMDLSAALDSIGLILGNRYLEKRFQTVIKDVRQGTSFTEALIKFKFFPDMLIQMVSVGEDTASIDDVLQRSCVYFDQCVEAALSSITSKIQPVMLLIMGGVIGSLFLAVYSPMLSIMTEL